MGEEIKHAYITRPVLDVYSISIHPIETQGCPDPFCDGKPCHVYGTVKVRDEYENVYHLYNRKQDDPDVIELGGNISLIGFPVIRSRILTLSVYLYDKAHQAEISNGTLVLNYGSEYSYDELQNSEVKGECGFVSVRHATFLYAVVAVVEKILIRKEDGGGGSSSDLYGNVFAHLVRDDGVNYASTLLFNSAAKFDAPVRLHRSCVAVPTFCKLRIEIKFRDENGSGIINRSFDRHIDHDSLYIESDMDQNLKIYLDISWPFLIEEFPRKTEVTQQVDAKQVFLQDLKASNIMPQLPSEPQPESSFFCNIFAKTSNMTYVEVFSVLIHSNDDDVLDVDGTISVTDSDGKSVHIFNGHGKLSTDSKTLAIRYPPNLVKIQDERFDITMSLKDGNGHVVGEGTCLWLDRMVDRYYNRYLCSVFKGELGYCTAVHYSIFRNSVQARVVVSFIKKDTQVCETSPEGVDVYGSVTGEYGSYQYPTPYNEEYYKYKLFLRSEDECSRLELGSVLELSKSVLPVPSRETLIVGVDLKVRQGGADQKFQALKRVVKFKHCEDSVFAVKNGGYILVMLVEWRSGNKDEKPFTSPNISDIRSLRKMMPDIRLKP